MRNIRVCVLLFCLVFLVGCNSAITNSSLQLTTDNNTVAAALEMPHEMKAFVDNPNVQWMAGMLAVLEDVEMIQGRSQGSYKVFTDPGDVIRATITTQNGLDFAQPFDLLVFADGVPMEFRVNGEAYLPFRMYLSPQKESVTIEFDQIFALNLGRLDFVLSFAENPQAGSHIISYTMWIELDSEFFQPASLCHTIEQREGLKGSYSGGSYNSWLWSEGIMPAETDNIGPRTISIQDGETVLLEAIASAPGLYRTVLVVDGTPIEFEMDGSQYSYLDWESTGTNMLQLPITLTDVPSTGSIYTITTPLDKDDLAQLIVASSKVELVEYKEE